MKIGHPIVIACPCDQDGFMSEEKHFLKVFKEGLE